MLKKLSFLTAIALSSSVFSQKIKINEFHVSSGTASMNLPSGSLEDFKTLAPNSVILTKDFSLFNQSYWSPLGYRYGMNQSSMYSVQLGLQCAKMPKATFRVGITHLSNYGLLTASGGYSISAPYDTLTSSQTGQQTILDTSYTKSYDLNYSNQQLRLDGAVIFRMFPEKRWSLHAGLGASFGYSYRANTNIRYSEYSSSSYSSSYSGNYSSEQETFKNKNSLGASLYIPLGIDFGIGKKRSFWMPFHIYLETRPSLNINSISNLGITFSPGMSSALGLRIKI